ncbi:MAG: FHA domain-containing protein [Acidobacteria bacterium]|nr:FHA domain-containing protein [Acidobacteriota bacterium]
MPEKEPVTKKGISPDWFMRGALSRIGDTVERLTGRHWQPSSSLATSQLIERLLALLEAEKKEVPGKGTVVPHNIKLKMQWDKFSTDEEATLNKLENELLAAAADHINDHLYYTYAPLHLEVKQDYFTEGVKLQVSFEDFVEEDAEVEMNVTMPAIKVPVIAPEDAKPAAAARQLIARFVLNGKNVERTIDIPADGRLTAGRTNSNGLMIDDISVSKVHASIAIDGDGLSVADTGSTNGTFINGVRIAYGKAVPFSETDNVKFGTVEVALEVIRPETAVEEEESHHDSIQIGEFEFRSRTAEPTQAEVKDEAPEIKETRPAISGSLLETQKIDDESDTQEDHSAEEKPE